MYIYRFFLNFESAKHLSNFLLLWNVNRKVKHFIYQRKSRNNRTTNPHKFGSENGAKLSKNLGIVNNSSKSLSKDLKKN